MTLSEYINSLKGLRIAVIGIGISNRPLIRLLLENGCTVSAHDKADRERLGDVAEQLESAGCELHLGESYLDNIKADVIFRSPGIRPDLPQFIAAVEQGAVLTSEMEAFFDVCPCRIIGITGSDGKTTTTTLISKMLERAGKTIHVGGNIGKPLLADADKMSSDDVCVLELSSFQLMTMKRSPDIAVITNVAPNHLDIHKDMEEYVSAKRNIFINSPQPKHVVLNADNDITRSFADLVEGEVRFFSRRSTVEDGVYFENGVIYSAVNGQSEKIMNASDILIPGVHNIENYMAAAAAVLDIVSFDDIIYVAKNFGGVEHRIELVRELKGVKYYNDSIASSPSRTIAGLRSFKQKVILIVGGKDKGVPFDELGEEIQKSVKALVATGYARQKIIDAVKKAGAGVPIVEKDDFCDAVISASEMADHGDIVVLSPACTSFDRFRNFEERGQLFKKIVNSLE